MSDNTELTKIRIKQDAEQRKKKRIIIFSSVGAFLVIAAIVAIYLFATFHKYTHFDEVATLDVGNSANNLLIKSFENGFIKCDNHGVTYFDDEEIFWDSDFEMSNPIMDVCQGYIIIADAKQSEAYIYDKSGLVNKVTSLRSILDVEISKDGRIALSTIDGESNFIEIKDVNGNEIINVKSIFSSSGYLSDITLSEDGNRLVATFIDVSQGTLLSKVLFYDFSNESTDDMLVGGFSQYEDTVLTTAAFVNNNNIAVIGDNAYSVYKFKDTPSIIEEQLELNWEIQSVSISDNYILFITSDDEGINNYKAHILSSSGKITAEFGFDFVFEQANICDSKVILTSGTDCQIYDFNGICKFEYSFDEKVLYMTATGKSNEYLLASSNDTKIIKLK